MTITPPLNNLDWQKGEGLIPAIVQDAGSGDVLMLGYMNCEALSATLQSKRVTFYSRSRKCLWQKGKTSGNTLKLIAIETDCDRDALLVLAEPSGPTCHKGTRSCFADTVQSDLPWLGMLDRLIEGRRMADPGQSYTAQLLGGPLSRAAQKVGEEGVEVALAAVSDDPKELPQEGADLLYHLMVLLRAKGLCLQDVIEVLRQRHREQ